MAVWNNCIFTNVGRQLIADCQANSKTLVISQCSTSSRNYTGVDLSNLTVLDDIKQTVNITEKLQEGDTYRVTANFDNTQVVTEYELYTYGVYANANGGANVLLLVGATDTPDTVPAISDAPWQAIINSHITIANAPDITINVDLSANATMQWVQDYTENYVHTIIETYVNNVVELNIPTSGWTTHTDAGGKNYYSHSFTLAGLKSTNIPIIALKPDNTINVATVKAKKKACRNLIGYECSDNSILIYSLKIPTTAFTIELKGVGI